jgi:DNA mismatch repair protein MutS
MALSIEQTLFETVKQETVQRHYEEILQCANALAAIDVASALARVATERHYCRPIVDER